MKRLTVLLAALMLAGCTDADGARKALNGAGYTDIQVGGYDVFACGQDDQYSTEFKAKGPTGKPVQGVVCSGVFKGSTIRTN